MSKNISRLELVFHISYLYLIVGKEMATVWSNFTTIKEIPTLMPTLNCTFEVQKATLEAERGILLQE